MDSPIYRPLNTQRVEIRLLELQAGSRTDTVRGFLAHACLDGDERPKYETISYCWGDSSITEEIFVNNSTLSVATSTAAALRRIRSPHAPIILWIDGVCIDQSNTKECSQQVQLMTEIYERSTANLVHLTDDMPLANRAAYCVQDIADMVLKDLGSDGRGIRGVPISELGKAIWSKLDWEALTELYRQELFGWVSRLWVVQEIVLAPRNKIFFGDFALDLEHLSHIVRWTSNHWNPLSETKLIGVIHGATGLWWQCNNKYFKKMRLGEPISLGVTLRLNRAAKTTILYDRIYAVLGLYRRHRNLPSLPELLEPDYSRPVDEVFCNATRFMILEEGHLQVLEDTVPKNQESEIPNLPTWVPRFFLSFDPFQHVAWLPLFRGFRASGGSHIREEDIKSVRTTNVLSVRGLAIDSVTIVLPKLGTEILDNAELLMDWLIAMRESYIGKNRKHTHIVGATLMFGIHGAFQRPTEEDTDGMEALIHYLGTHKEFPALGHLDPKDCIKPCASCFYDDVNFKGRNRSVFYTSSGQIGLGNEDVAAGDELVILQGGDKPVILRASGEYYNYVCACYVHDLMDGEAWKGEDDAQMRVFNIR